MQPENPQPVVLPASQADPPAPQQPVPSDVSSGGERKKKLGVIGTVGALLLKFKTLGLVILTKGKLVLLGLTKLNTLLSMLVSIGFYWALYGWKFGLGFVLSIYVHEMGHVMALASYGIPASPPMFIPGIGAFVRLKAYPASPGEDARVGLAGPLWGLGAALACMGIGVITGSGLFTALAKVGAWINVFNLIPVWQLDGSRGFRALTRHHRILIAALSGLLWLWTSETMLILVGLVALWRCFTKDAPEQPDNVVFFQFAGLLAALSGVYHFTK
jgi:Zn-dependent protease